MAKLVLDSKKKNKKVEVIKDENGYYKVTFGAFNTFNKSGIYYNVPDVNKIIGPDSLVGRRIKEGILFSEVDHPDISDCLARSDKMCIANKTIKLDPNNKCCHIKKIEIEVTNKVEPGFKNPIVLVHGWVKPDGPKKDVLADALENPDYNVHFSVRSLVNERKVGKLRIRDVLLVSTWDHVAEGGVKYANQWYTAGVESMDLVVDKDLLDKIMLGYESLDCKDGKCVIKTLKETNPFPKEALEILRNW